MAESKKKSIVHSALWVYGKMVVVQLLNIVAIGILARKLSIDDFGLVALSTVFMAFLSIIASQGINQFVIYDKDAGFEERVSAAFWLSLVISIGAIVIGGALAPLVSQFYEEPLLKWILWVLLLRFPLESIAQIPDAILNKRLEFKPLEIRDTVLQVIAILISIFMAFDGYGVWALVIPSLLILPFKAITSFYLAKWRPAFKLGLSHWKRIFKYSSNVMGGSFVYFIVSQGDTLLVGKVLGTTMLGIYDIAWKASNIVSRNVVNLSNKLSFPYLASLADKREGFINALNRLFKILSSVTFPILFLLMILADEFVITLYGPKWGEAILPLQILLIYAIRYSVGAPIGAAFKAYGRPDMVFKIGLATIPFYLISIWIGSFWGIIGVAIGVTIVRTLIGLISFFILGNILKCSTMAFFNAMKDAALASLTTGLIIIFVKKGLVANLDWPIPLKFFILFGLGALVYYILIRQVFRSIAEEFAKIAFKLVGRNNLIIKKVLNVH